MLFLLSRDHGRPAQALTICYKSERPLLNVRDNPCPPSKTHATNATDPPPLKWSDLRYVFDIKEDWEAIQA